MCCKYGTKSLVPPFFIVLKKNFSLSKDKTCYDTLFQHEDMHEIMQHFAVCHVDAPGQHEGANTFSTG